NVLVNILKRATELAKKGEKLFATPALQIFLYNKFRKKDFLSDKFCDICSNWYNYYSAILCNSKYYA
ncbi:MAG: hypothetical protein U9R34_01800, partial [Nanoarchaeota archaeon]|nr:hypothetical protein [Nanoarchaeota archaeon]